MSTQVLAKYALIGSDLELIENVALTLDDQNTIVDIEELSRDIDTNIVVMPGLFNAHVHAADIELRNKIKGNLSELVGPGGIKHRYLNGLSQEKLNQVIQQSHHEALSSGTLGWSDFREGGLKGLSPYPISDTWLAFARPLPEEVEHVPDFAHFGIRDVLAYSTQVLSNISRIATKKGKKVFIHASEDLQLRKRWISEYGSSDVIWEIENSKIDAVIHLTHADEEDIKKMKLNNVGGVVCLRSNKFTGVGEPPIAQLLEANILLGIGTDNAMFSRLSLWDEMKALSEYGIGSRQILQMASINGALLCGLDWGVATGNSNFLAIKKEPTLKSSEIYDWLVHSCESSRIVKRYCSF